VAAFWERITEGMELEELWSQFKHETRSGYQLYSREIEHTHPRHARDWFRVAGGFFWAVVMKLSPAKRLVLLLGLLLLFLPTVEWRTTDGIQGSSDFRMLGGGVILLLFVLEVADRVTMKRDLQIAREIQSWLVPGKPPSISGVQIAFTTQPANTVAGDYYDAFWRDKAAGSRHVLLAVADVAGKSVPAALLMATFQASLRTLSNTPSSLPDLTAGMNRYACEHSLSGSRFTTAYLGEFDPLTRELIYVNAGHNAPILLRANGCIERLQAGGVPLGILSDAVYTPGSTAVEPGDTLVIFTYGVVEAVNDRGEEYGEARLLTVLNGASSQTAEQVIARLMQDVQRFTAMAPQHDDITCMVLKVEANRE
jgi:sigma-B regulation protein RsbU (phosphoserine phosphatase)